MITYEKLRKKPQVAKSLIGMSLAEFAGFYAEFESAHEERLQASQKTRRGQKRQRDVGRGSKAQVRFARPLADDLVPLAPPARVGVVEDLHHLRIAWVLL